jgi:hypothetical protein
MLNVHPGALPWPTAFFKGLKPHNTVRAKVLPVTQGNHVTFGNAHARCLLLVILGVYDTDEGLTTREQISWLCDNDV